MREVFMGQAWKQGTHITSTPILSGPGTRPRLTAGEAERHIPVVYQVERGLAWGMTAALKHERGGHEEERTCWCGGPQRAELGSGVEIKGADLGLM